MDIFTQQISDRWLLYKDSMKPVVADKQPYN